MLVGKTASPNENATPLPMKRNCLVALAVASLLAWAALAQQPAGGRPNLLVNPSFENGQEGWEFSSWNKQGVVAIDKDETRDGEASLRIHNPAGDDSFLRQTVAVKPQTRYRLSGVIKTDEVVTKSTGATIALEGGFEKTKSVTGRKSWTRVDFEFETGPLNQIKVGPRLGHNSSMATGTAWFDDLSLVELGPARR